MTPSLNDDLFVALLDNASDQLVEEVKGIVWLTDQPELVRAGQTPILMAVPDPLFGTHQGVASRRPFFFDEIALPLEKRSLKGLEITHEGIGRVKHHLARLDHDFGNDEMVARLEKILAGDLAYSVYDARFYSHELRELERFEAAGWQYGFYEAAQPLYHPDAENDDE